MNTCGSQVCHRVYRLTRDRLSLHEYYEYVKKQRGADNTSYDMIVASCIRSKLKRLLSDVSIAQ